MDACETKIEQLERFAVGLGHLQKAIREKEEKMDACETKIEQLAFESDLDKKLNIFDNQEY